MFNQKKILYWLIPSVIVVLIIGFYLISKIKVNTKPEQNPNFPGSEGTGVVSPSPTPTLSSQDQAKLQIIAKGKISAFWPAATNTVQYFKDNNFWEANYSVLPIKEEKRELGVNYGKIISINPAYGRVLIKYESGGSQDVGFSVLDTEAKTLKNMDLTVKEAAWSPDGKNIIFFDYEGAVGIQPGLSQEKHYLGQMTRDLKDKKVLLDWNVSSDLILSWPTANIVYLTQKPSAEVEQTALAFDLKNKTFKPFASGRGLIVNWSPNGQYGLVFSSGSDGTKPVLQLINKDGLSLGTFPNPVLPEKCVFSAKEAVLYCAIPEIKHQGFWPDDYYLGMFSQKEALYKINLQNMEASPILSQAIFEVFGIRLNSEENHLIFFDKLSENLYGLSL